MDSHHKLGVPNAPAELLITPCNPGDMFQVSVSTEILKFVSIILNSLFSTESNRIRKCIILDSSTAVQIKMI